MSTRRGKFQTCPYVRGSIGIMWGRDGRFANRPYGEGGWMVGGGRCGQDWGMDSRLRLHGGGLRGNNGKGGVAGRIGGWIPASVFTGAGFAREQRVGMWEEGEHEKGQV